MRSYFSLGLFAREFLGYTHASEKGCMKLLHELEHKNIIEIQQSGFRGDSMHHGRLVIVKDWYTLLLSIGIQYRYEAPKMPQKSHPKRVYHEYEHPPCNYLRPCPYKMESGRCRIEITCNQRGPAPDLAKVL